MDIIYNSLFKIDINEASAAQIPLPDGTNDLRSYIIDLLDKIVSDPDKKGFEFESEKSGVKRLIEDIVNIKGDDYDTFSALTLELANRLHKREQESDKRNNLGVDLLKGIAVMSLVRFQDGMRKMIISKADYNEFLDVLSYTKRQGFPIKKKIYKAFVAEVDTTDNITKVAVYDTNSVFTVYWYRDFLELTQVHTDEHNTEQVFNVIETKILNPIKKTSKRDYIELWNATIRYFRIRPEFTLDGFIEDIISSHVPFDPNLDIHDLESKTRKQLAKGNFDSKFNIAPNKISKRFKNSIPLTPQIDLNIKDGIQNLKGTIQRYEEKNGDRWVMIKSSEGFDYFTDTDVMTNE
ncbi:nucleoid-associated protein [Mucilaginibacter sp. SMC90]|uniref:nucleoid-associated protein n=1 Tax=Mucilaginibacter sp. SMC90 TaxID=2929803 RepID=UPI001FB290AB|nr:nucleoid-associated protein [Mucilaginibacter sp. SMC90]UOE48708.1 nucleoid-associated protein [Mucilaginibacter sp. SMC90]